MHIISHITAAAARGSIKTTYILLDNYSLLQNTNSQKTVIQFAVFQLLEGNTCSI